MLTYPCELTVKQEVLKQKGAKRLLVSLLTILAADVTMSLDNILAVGALASGNILFLIIGLVISLCILLVGSSFIAKLMDHLPWLLDIACLILAWTASHIFLGDGLHKISLLISPGYSILPLYWRLRLSLLPIFIYASVRRP